jgi:hypothetical protein
MNTEYDQIVIVAGTLFSRVQELRALLQELKGRNHCQGEFRMFHRAADGKETELIVYVDGLSFTMMPSDQANSFRLDSSDSALWLE